MRGKDSKTVVTNQTQKFSLKFGDKQSFDQATEKLFKEFCAKVSGSVNGQGQTYFEILEAYLMQMLNLEQPIVWEKVDLSDNNEIELDNLPESDSE